MERLPAILRHLAQLTTLLAALVAPSLRAEQPKLAVLEFELQKGLTLDRRTFSAKLQNAARKAVPGYLVMTQGNIETLVTAAGKTLAECEGQCAVDTGKLVGADIVITGRISKVGKTFALSMQMYDTASGALLAGEDPEARDEDELLRVSAEAADRLLAPLARRGQRGQAAGGGGGAGKEGRIEEQEAALEAGGTEEVLVAFTTEPAGAVVQLDGKLLCQASPCKKLVPVGPHELSLQKEGYEDVAQALSAKKGLVVRQRLLRISARLDVETDPAGLGVSIDGEKVGQGPVRQQELAAGTHEVLIDDACWLRGGERVVLKRGEDRTVRLAGKPRVARLTVSAEDEQGNAVEGRAKADGAELGAVPGTFTVSSCVKTISVEAGGQGAEQAVALVEGKATKVSLKLASLGPRPGRTSKEGKSGVELVALPGGKLHGGNFNGQTVAPFSLARTATTVAQYARCVAAGGCSEPQKGGSCNWKTGRDDHPVNCVDWNQAKAFCAWMGARLPTSEEREWAASSGMGWAYPWGNEEPGARACWNGSGNDRQSHGWSGTCPVGSHPQGASKQGVQDLAGNGWEWLATDYGGGKEVRGGSWGGADAGDLRASYRLRSGPTLRGDDLGVRCGL